MRVVKVVIILACCLASIAVVGARPASAPPLLLHRARLRPSGAPAQAASQLLASASGEYRIIQFGGPIAAADRDALAATGLEILEYIPEFSYLVRGTPAQLTAVAQLPAVVAQQPFALADKISPALYGALERGAAPGPLHVIAWPGQESALANQLRAAAVQPSALPNTGSLLQVANLPAVRWVEPASQPKLLNDVARGFMHVNAAWQDRGLYGAGQTIAIADSGLDTGNPATLSPDFAGRVAAAHILAPGGTLADEFGHGTHIAGSAAGAGVQSGAQPGKHKYSGSFAGVAPEAKLVVQAFEVDAENNVVGLGDDYYPMFAQAYADGARIHSDSWGDETGPASDPAAQFGRYPATAQRTDQFVWDHPDMAIFFAAGNSGRDGVPGGEYGFCLGNDGIVDPDSLVAPGTAKNVITVGASESERSEGGYSQVLWVYFGGEKFCLSADPVASDSVSNNANGMAAFSSRGPTDDGRIKPDIVAPGTNILSNRSHVAGADTLWGEYDANYAYSGGTSMATPLVAGAGALVRQWLAARGLLNPSAAAVKATLLNTTYDIGPGQYGTGAAREIPTTRPNSVDGWGRADLAFMSAAQPYTLWVDDHTQGIGTGQTVSYTSSAARSLDVLDSSQPLRVMLAWSDPPASLSVAKQLVNDLDLVVIGPNNTEYRGNGVAGGDRLNNVEGVIIPHPVVGRYTIRVRGYNVPVKSQPYALAVSGALSASGQMLLAGSASPAVEVNPGELLTYTLALSANRNVTSAVALTDALPPYTQFVSASDGGTFANGKVSWSIAPFAAHATPTRTLVVRVAAGAPAGTAILNSHYHATDGASLQSDGAPIVVRVKGPVAVAGARVFVPMAGR